MCELNLWGIETSLKRPATLKLALCELNLWGIETPIFLGVPGQSPLVWIEPVRDWNPKSKNPQKQKNKCELNLWGIETTFTSVAPKYLIIVWIEPVRDWNF